MVEVTVRERIVGLEDSEKAVYVIFEGRYPIAVSSSEPDADRVKAGFDALEEVEVLSTRISGLLKRIGELEGQLRNLTSGQIFATIFEEELPRLGNGRTPSSQPNASVTHTNQSRRFVVAGGDEGIPF